MRMMPRALQAPCTDGARGAGGSFSIVGAQRTVQNDGNVKSEPKYLAYEGSPVRALLLNSFLFFSCSTVD